MSCQCMHRVLGSHRVPVHVQSGVAQSPILNTSKELEEEGKRRRTPNGEGMDEQTREEAEDGHFRGAHEAPE